MIRLGKTDLMVSRTAFGALPLQRVDKPEAVALLRRAYDGGINFYDTANVYTDSEEKLGEAFSGIRSKVIIATKSMASNRKGVLDHLEESLRRLKTDYLDLFQLHNIQALPDSGDPDSPYAALKEAQRKGWVRYIGVTAHRLPVAQEAALSGLYDTVQFPFSYLSSPEELDFIELCRDKQIGFVAMKSLCGGLLNYAPAAFAFARQYENVVPIWGIQHSWELDEFLALESEPPALKGDIAGRIEQDRRELSENFCRGCGYCLPCPADIEIFIAARMKFLLRRAPYQQYIAPAWRKKMQNITNCIHCGACARRCPYGLNPEKMLGEMLTDYEEFYSEHCVKA